MAYNALPSWARRIPRGMRGLKSFAAAGAAIAAVSHPSRDAWIEIQNLRDGRAILSSRIPRGMRGLKSLIGRIAAGAPSRIPRGMRGLKLRPHWRS